MLREIKQKSVLGKEGLSNPHCEARNRVQDEKSQALLPVRLLTFTLDPSRRGNKGPKTIRDVTYNLFIVV